MDTEDVDDLRKVVKANNEGGAVSGDGEWADEHERRVEVVSASKEPGERHGGHRRLDLLELVDIVLLLELLRHHARMDIEDVDNLRKVVKANDEGGAMSGSGEGANEHERPVEVVSTSKEPRERHGGRRQLDLLGSSILSSC